LLAGLLACLLLLFCCCQLLLLLLLLLPGACYLLCVTPLLLYTGAPPCLAWLACLSLSLFFAGCLW